MSEQQRSGPADHPACVSHDANVHGPHQRDGASADEGRWVQSLEKGFCAAAPASAQMCAPALPLSAHGCRDKEAWGFLGGCQPPRRTSKKQKTAAEGKEPSASNLQHSTGIRFYGGVEDQREPETKGNTAFV